MSDIEGETIPEGAPVYEFSADLLALMAQPEMQSLRRLLTTEGARLLLAQLCSMDRNSLLKLRSSIAPPLVPARSG